MGKKRKQRKQHGFTACQVVSVEHQLGKIDAIVLGESDTHLYVRPIGEFHQVSPHVPLAVLPEDATPIDTNNPEAPLCRHWARVAAPHIMGRTIRNVRYLTPDECIERHWGPVSAIVLELDDGTRLMPFHGGSSAGIFIEAGDGDAGNGTYIPPCLSDDDDGSSDDESMEADL